MWYTILEENSRSVLVRMPKSYLSRLDNVNTPKSSGKTRLSDDVIAPEEQKHYLEAKRDLENGMNVVSWDKILEKYGQ